MAHLSNQRFAAIHYDIEDLLNDLPELINRKALLQKILDIICKRTNYDPSASQYNEQKAKTIREYQKRKALEKKQQKLKINV